MVSLAMDRLMSMVNNLYIQESVLLLNTCVEPRNAKLGHNISDFVLYNK